MVFGNPFQLGVSLFEDRPVFELVSDCSEEQIQTIIPSAHRQVLGNAYVIKNERVTVPEFQVQTG